MRSKREIGGIPVSLKCFRAARAALMKVRKKRLI